MSAHTWTNYVIRPDFKSKGHVELHWTGPGRYELMERRDDIGLFHRWEQHDTGLEVSYPEELLGIIVQEAIFEMRAP